MKKSATLTLLVCSSLGTGNVSAEGLYGSGDLAANWQHTRDYLADSNDEAGLIASGYLGYRFGSGLFVEGELRFQDMSDDSSDGLDGLQNSSLGVLRGGMEFGAATAEIILGATAVRTGQGQSALNFGGLGGAYALSDRATLRGMVVRLIHATGEGDEEEDVLKDATAVSLGLAYGVSEQITVWGDAAYADGIMDGAREMSLVKEISLGADYAFATPGLKAFGKISYADLYQGANEWQSAYDTRISLGITYSFGAVGSRDQRKRAPLPNIENWMTITAGVLE